MAAVASLPFRVAVGKEVEDYAVSPVKGFESHLAGILIPALEHPDRIGDMGAEAEKDGAIGFGQVHALNIAALMERVGGIVARTPHNLFKFSVIYVRNFCKFR